MIHHLFMVRATGLLIEDEKLLIVKQKVSSERTWSLPGGKVERGESLEEAMKREIWEETGLQVNVKKLLYVCEKPEANPPLIHITFLLEKVAGEITMPSNEYETTPIHEVKLVPISDLPSYGFSETFTSIVQQHFPEAGSYKGNKQHIGL